MGINTDTPCIDTGACAHLVQRRHWCFRGIEFAAAAVSVDKEGLHREVFPDGIFVLIEESRGIAEPGEMLWVLGEPYIIVFQLQELLLAEAEEVILDPQTGVDEEEVPIKQIELLSQNDPLEQFLRFDVIINAIYKRSSAIVQPDFEVDAVEYGIGAKKEFMDKEIVVAANEFDIGSLVEEFEAFVAEISPVTDVTEMDNPGLFRRGLDKGVHAIEVAVRIGDYEPVVLMGNPGWQVMPLANPGMGSDLFLVAHSYFQNVCLQHYIHKKIYTIFSFFTSFVAL